MYKTSYFAFLDPDLGEIINLCVQIILNLTALHV